MTRLLLAGVAGIVALPAFAQQSPGLPPLPSTAADRANWFVQSTAGPGSLLGGGTLSAAWGEDPRYHPSPARPFGARAGHVVKMSFMARRGNGSLMPACSRYIAIPGNHLLTNRWRERSENDLGSALLRTGYGFLSRMGGNAFADFRPDVTRKVFKRK